MTDIVLSFDERKLFESLPARLVIDDVEPTNRAWFWVYVYERPLFWPFEKPSQTTTKDEPLGACLADLAKKGLIWRGRAQLSGVPEDTATMKSSYLYGFGMTTLGLQFERDQRRAREKANQR